MTPKTKPSSGKPTAAKVAYRTVKIDGLDIFYREAGPQDAPVVLLLHGFPTSSHMFRNLIRALADEFRLVAPDYPGFGNSSILPWSSKYLQECYQVAGEAYGWSKRDPKPGSMRDGNYLIGWGMATATYPGIRSPGAAKVRILQDGSAMVSSATQDMGGGTYTTMTQVVSDVMGIPVNRIHPALGDSYLPPAPVSGGLMTTARMLPAVKLAAQNALKNLVRAALAD
jgi:CO/xanthine dehydrogenase Mo-binding subunit